MSSLFIGTGNTPEKLKQLKELPLFAPISDSPEKSCQLARLSPLPVQSGKCGRIPVHVKFPEIVPIAQDLVVATGYKAAQRRDSTVGQIAGTRMWQLRDRLLQRVAGLKSISTSTTSRLFYPPNAGHVASKNYKKVVEAKVPQLRNDLPSANDDSHAYSGRVRGQSLLTTWRMSKRRVQRSRS